MIIIIWYLPFHVHVKMHTPMGVRTHTHGQAYIHARHIHIPKESILESGDASAVILYIY